VRVWREDEGGWSAAAVDVDGAFTAGDSLAEVERQIRESIAARLDLPRGAEADMTVTFEVSIDNGGPVDQLVSTARAAREAATRAAAATEAAVTELRGRGVSVRDVSRLVGVTPGRVSQLGRGAA